MASVPVTVESFAAADQTTAFTVAVPIDLSLIFTGYGPLPAVRGVENQSSPWDRAGATRRALLSDGSSATERLTTYTAPDSFAYEITGFTGILRHFVASASGIWHFTPATGGTRIVWTYTFHPLPGRTPLVHTVALLWRRYMRQALARTIKEITRTPTA